MSSQNSELPKGTMLVKKSNKDLLVGLVIGLIMCLILNIIAVNNPMSEVIAVSVFFLGVSVFMLIIDSILY